jgi:hypothetical protein
MQMALFVLTVATEFRGGGSIRSITRRDGDFTTGICGDAMK